MQYFKKVVLITVSALILPWACAKKRHCDLYDNNGQNIGTMEKVETKKKFEKECHDLGGKVK